jgi:Tfp pilus assembly protein PilO
VTLPDAAALRRFAVPVAAGLFAAANLAFFLTYRSTFQERRGGLEARRDDLKRSVHAQEMEARRLEAQRDRLNGVSTAIDEFYGRRIGTQRETLAAVVDDLHAALKEAGVTTSQISYTTAAVEKLPLTQMRVGFSIRCDYGRFKRLLELFDAGPRWLVVRGVGISRDNEVPGSVQVQLELVTYFSERPGPAEPARPVPEKAVRDEEAKKPGKAGKSEDVRKTEEKAARPVPMPRKAG